MDLVAVQIERHFAKLFGTMKTFLRHSRQIGMQERREGPNKPRHWSSKDRIDLGKTAVRCPAKTRMEGNGFLRN